MTRARSGQLVAHPTIRDGQAKDKEKLGPDHPHTLISMENLAKAYQQKGDFAKAELILRECLSLRQKQQPDAWRTFVTPSELGGSLVGQKHYGEAELLLRAGYEGMKEREAKIPPTPRST